MADKVRWGVLSTAKIAREKVIPAMQSGRYCEVTAIASRNAEIAKSMAEKLAIQNSYDSYEALLADPGVDAVYIPLPNHLHVPWAIKALEADKHVLCEKPISLDATQAGLLSETARQRPHLKVMEAFMYRFHPQWVKTRQLVGHGRIGEVEAIQSVFSYYNDDSSNIRNQPGIGGGGLMDIGCYNISLSRFILDKEPERVFGVNRIDDRFEVDILTSGILDFGPQISSFICGTQMAPHQGVQIYGTRGRIEIPVPFNPPTQQSTVIRLYSGGQVDEISFDPCDQYTLQGDLFSQAVLNRSEVPTPLNDAIANMRVIDAVLKSAETRSWQSLV